MSGDDARATAAVSGRNGLDLAHTGPGTLAGQYLRRFWQPVIRSEDLPPGRAAPIRIMGQDLTAYRGDPGNAHLLGFRCAHRGTQLSTGWVEGDDLRCFYHGWKYEASGQCVEQPAEPEPFCQKIRIPSYSVHEYLGLVFAYLGEASPPPFPRLPWFERDGVLEVHSQTLPCNFFNRLDNSVDPVHIPYVHRHPSVAEYIGNGAPLLEAVEQPWGITTRTTWPNGAVTIQQVIMPNLFVCDIGQSEWSSVLLGWRVPIDDSHFMSINVTHGRTTGPDPWGWAGADRMVLAQEASRASEDILAGRMSIIDLADRRAIFEVQDYIAQVGQGIIAHDTPEHLGRSDTGVVLLRRLWARELRALAEGQPLTEWAIPESIELATGGV